MDPTLPTPPPPAPEPGYGPVTPIMIEHLEGTRPWVAFLSVLGFIVAGVMVLAALFMMIAGSFAKELTPLGGFFVGLLYLIIAFIYAATCYYLFRYGASIRKMATQRDGRAMEEALGYQKSFWRILGIIGIVYLGIIGLGLLFGLFAALMVGARG